MLQHTQNEIILEPNPNTQPTPEQLKQTYPLYNYQLVPPYWPFPLYNVQDYESNKFYFWGCRHCRAITYRSVMTQTPDNIQQQAEQNQSSNIQFEQENYLQFPRITIPEQIVKQQENQNQIISLRSNNSYRSVQELSKIKLNQIQQQRQEQEQAHQSQKGGHSKHSSLQISDKNQINGSSSINGVNINNNFNSNQQLFSRMLRLYMINDSQYNLLVGDYLNQDTIFAQLVKNFHNKLCSFKKSKQQMIKLIIRKTQRHYKMEHNCKKDERFKKFGGFKSMNSIYLEKLFSDPDFIRSYTIITKDFIQEFQKESQQKLTDFTEKICLATDYAELKSAIKSIDEKNKMPWPAWWIEKLRKVTNELRATYIGSKSIELSSHKKKTKRG